MTDHSDLIAHLTRLGKLDGFLNRIPRPNPNELALSRIVPPPMPYSSRHKAILRLERMQRDLFPNESRKQVFTSEVNVRRIA